MDTDDLTPLGELLEVARKAARPKLSQNEAARRAGISGTTWRRVIKGIASFGGVKVAFNGAPDTVAHMAHVVSVGPDQLTTVGREDAAEQLRDLTSEPREERLIDDFEAQIERIRRNPAARARLMDLIRIARLDTDEEDQRGHHAAG